MTSSSLAVITRSWPCVTCLLVQFELILHLPYRGGFHAGTIMGHGDDIITTQLQLTWHTIEHTCASSTVVQDIIIMYSAGPVQVAWTRRKHSHSHHHSWHALASVTVPSTCGKCFQHKDLVQATNRYLTHGTDRWNLCCDVIALIALANGYVGRCMSHFRPCCHHRGGRTFAVHDFKLVEMLCISKKLIWATQLYIWNTEI